MSDEALEKKIFDLKLSIQVSKDALNFAEGQDAENYNKMIVTDEQELKPFSQLKEQRNLLRNAQNAIDALNNLDPKTLGKNDRNKWQQFWDKVKS